MKTDQIKNIAQAYKSVLDGNPAPDNQTQQMVSFAVESHPDHYNARKADDLQKPWKIDPKTGKKVWNRTSEEVKEADPVEESGDPQNDHYKGLPIHKKAAIDRHIRNGVTYWDAARKVGAVAEDVQQVDELSNNTLLSYIGKSAAQRRKAKSSIEKHMTVKRLTDKNVSKNLDANKLFRKRGTGMSLAAAKMTESSWPILARIQEKKDRHTDGALAAEPLMNTTPQGEKDFVNMHKGPNSKTPPSFVDDNVVDKKGPMGVKVAPKRHNDSTVGDKDIVKSGTPVTK